MLSRYRIEPRGVYDCFKKGAETRYWLVLFDKESGKYITEPNSRKYKRFKDSDEIKTFVKKERRKRACPIGATLH